MTTEDDKHPGDEEWLPAKQQVDVTVGESVRIMRQLQGAMLPPVVDGTNVPLIY